MAERERRGPTSSQLRAAIDGGAAGDKAPFADPAAAPLGADDEAAGAPPSPEQVAMSFRAEVDARPAERDAHASASAPTAGLAVERGAMRARRQAHWAPYAIAATLVAATAGVWLVMAALA